jgi:hypothetical protein
LDKGKRYSVTASYEKGQEPPAFTDVEMWKLGLGIKF